MSRTAFDAAFAQRIVGYLGPAGERWLEALPQRLDACRERWGLNLGEPFPLGVSYTVAASDANHNQYVLKLGGSPEGVSREAAYLRQLDGRATCRMIDMAPDLGALLLERVTPGTTLAQLALRDDAAATQAAIDVCHRLWPPAPDGGGFPDLRTYTIAIDEHRERFGGGGPIPAHLFDAAVLLREELLTSSPVPCLLHGDLHHFNILRAERAPWLVIDPKGVVGDPTYDLAAFLYNPIPELLTQANPEVLINNRVAQLADGLDLDRERIRGWGIVQAVLSACWSTSANEDITHVVTCGEYLLEGA